MLVWPSSIDFFFVSLQKFRHCRIKTSTNLQWLALHRFHFPSTLFLSTGAQRSKKKLFTDLQNVVRYVYRTYHRGKFMGKLFVSHSSFAQLLRLFVHFPFACCLRVYFFRRLSAVCCREFVWKLQQSQSLEMEWKIQHSHWEFYTQSQWFFIRR